MSLEQTVKISNGLNFCCTYDGCVATFDRQWKLDGHICGHTNERPFKCETDNCDKAYRTKSHLQRHINTTHVNRQSPKKVYPCTYPNCLKVVQNKYNLKKHLLTHARSQRLHCSICNLSFKKQNSLISHNYYHIGKPQYECKTCSCKYWKYKDLARHMHQHKEYKCEYDDCSVIVSNWNEMRRHMKDLHPSVYDCNNCMKSFNNKKLLEDHVMSHLLPTDRPVLLCTYDNCNRSYYYKRNLQQHIQSFHNLNKFECNECNKLLSTKAKLVLHKKQHEPGYVIKPKQKRRGERWDKGLPTKSFVSRLSGVKLPNYIDKLIARNELSIELEEEIEKVLMSTLQNTQ